MTCEFHSRNLKIQSYKVVYQFQNKVEMDKVGMRDRLIVISELTQGREIANELKNQLYPVTTQKDTCNFLLEKILSSYDNALAQLEFLGNGNTSQCVVTDMFHSPNSVQGSPWSEGSDPDSKDHVHKHVVKKRKLLPKWSEKVKLCPGKEFDSQFVDGYNWRKYGQKAILGTNNPRSYYRCTHRSTQGCLATKQVQRTDADPSIFDVIYQGKHSCTQERLKQKKEKNIISNELARQRETQELDPKDDIAPPFSFPSTPKPDNLGAHFFSDQSNFNETSYLPMLSSPPTPESNFSLNDFDFGNFQNIPEFEITETNSNPNPFADFALENMDVFTNQVGFDSHFLDTDDYFS